MGFLYTEKGDSIHYETYMLCIDNVPVYRYNGCGDENEH